MKLLSTSTPVPYYQSYTITDANGQPRTYTLNFENNHFAFNPVEGCWEHLDGWLTSINLPNGTAYTFEYNAWQGYLTKVTLPTGGYIEYEYTGGDTETGYGADSVVERRVSADGSTEKTWTYARSNSGSTRYVTVTSPEGHEVIHTFNNLGQKTQTEYRNATSESPQQTVTTTWTNGLPTQVDTVMGSVKRRTTRAWIGSAVLLDYQEDSDWYPVAGSVIPRTKVDYSYVSSIRPSSLELLAWDGSTYVTQGRTEYEYDEDSPTATSSSVPNKSTPLSNRFNLSTVRRYKDASNYVEEHFHYDDLGNVLEAVDALGKITAFDYTDNFTDSTNHYSYAFPTAVTNALMQSVTSKYNFSTGLPTLLSDRRGLETEFTYDLMNRLEEVTEPNGRVTTMTYTDATPKVKQEVLVASGKTRTTETTLDKLLRPIQVKLFDPAGDVFANTEYDGDGRVERVSAPYRSGTPVWTETAYDVLNRPLTITNPDSTTIGFEYAGNVVTTTDEAGNQRRQTLNSSGQLTKVEEPDPDSSGYLETDYAYYVFGPLKQVTQGVQTRTFTGDWLGRITQEQHPETGITFYEYNAAGLLTERKDERNMVTTYAYDDIGRIYDVTYTDDGGVTPDVHYRYDQNGFIGFLTTAKTTDPTGPTDLTSSTFEYDDGGNLTQESVLRSGVTGTFTTGYEYDLDGRLLEVSYPSGRVVTQTYASSGGIASDRTASLTDSETSTTLLQSVEDNAAGLLTNRTLGGGISETRTFNMRNQLTRIAAAANDVTLLDMGYGYGTANDGRIRGRTDGVQPEHSASYEFDKIGRLTQVTGGDAVLGNNWGIAWDLDRWGNRTEQTPSGLASGRVGSPIVGYPSNANKSTSWEYDEAGNITGVGTDNFDYDAENRLIQINSGTVYAYDHAGRRIKRTVGSTTTYYFYGLTGLMSEFDTVDTGITEAAATDRLQYRVGEQTGTAVMLVGSDGTARENNRVFPFGEPWNSFAESNDAEKFTTYQHDDDDDTDLDYAMARYYASRSGRFMTPDPGHIGRNVGDPQSWNAYVYSSNDPINFVDPLGLCRIKNGALVEDGGAPCGPSTSITVYDSTGSPFDVADIPPGRCVGVYSDWLYLGDVCGRDGSNGGDSGGGGGGGGGRVPTVSVTTGPLKESPLNCIQRNAESISLQSILRGTTNGRLGNGWLSSVLLGNDVSEAISFLRNASSLRGTKATGNAGNLAASEAAGAVASRGLIGLSRITPEMPFVVNPSFYLGEAYIRLAELKGTLPLQKVFRGAAFVVSKVKLPYDLTATAFSAIGCGALGN